MSAIKAAVYIRVARECDYAIKIQEQVVTGFAKANGFSDYTLYSDNGESGLTLNRPSMNRLMADIRNGKIGTVIAKDFIRIARDLLLLGEWLDFVQKHGVKVTSVQDGDFDGWVSRPTWFKEFSSAM